MSRRQNEGAETITRLREWYRGQAAAERLAAQLLIAEGFVSVDPSHPLGGPDNLKDVKCSREGKEWIAAAYFPSGQQKFNHISNKFNQDFGGAAANNVDGFVFVTNQELTLGQRDTLKMAAGNTEIDLFHLERVAALLNSPSCYGIRLEFLDIEMTKEEQLAFFATLAANAALFQQLQRALDALTSRLSSSEQTAISIPISELREFRSILNEIAGNPSPLLNYPVAQAGSLYLGPRASVRDLRVPIDELKEYEAILDRVLEKLREKKRLEGS